MLPYNKSDYEFVFKQHRNSKVYVRCAHRVLYNRRDRAYTCIVWYSVLAVAADKKDRPAQFARRGIRSNVMNKSEFIKELQEKTDYTEEQCIVINSVMENHFIFRKKNKLSIVADIADKLSIDETEADAIFELCMGIIRAEKKNALKHPFGSRKKSS